MDQAKTILKRRGVLRSMGILFPSLAGGSEMVKARKSDSQEADSHQQSIEQLLGSSWISEWPTASEVHRRDIDPDPAEPGWAYTLTQSAELQSSSSKYDPLSGDDLIVDGHFGLCVAERDAPGVVQSTFDEAHQQFRRYRNRYPDHVTLFRTNSINGYTGSVLRARPPIGSETPYSQASLVQQFPWGLVLWDLLWDSQSNVYDSKVATRHHEWLQTHFQRLQRRPTFWIRDRWQQLHDTTATSKLLTVGLPEEAVTALAEDMPSTLVERRSPEARETAQRDSSVTWSPETIRDA
ncbi:hypothetical protein [Haloplanus aerogenes]|uniref:Uncharacterized protein n=1 Tax=Haloplanus aerogenes TaxID=660522 RepID=A0A3M0CWN9_9EURY|nr:hypothetical protein [Haloplanus aerogenes]AZH26025.1 hypothetical protein DU502_11930 [Haloplanus aerogenes]RMB08243.1 hypothetical protein ATH50_3658 [Haloplanus aerogenes]